LAEWIPNRGKGGRCLDCDRYDACLDIAAYGEWECFNCEGCAYEGRGALNFYPEAFLDLPLGELLEGIDGFIGGFGCSILEVLGLRPSVNRPAIESGPGTGASHEESETSAIEENL